MCVKFFGFFWSINSAASQKRDFFVRVGAGDESFLLGDYFTYEDK